MPRTASTGPKARRTPLATTPVPAVASRSGGPDPPNTSLMAAT
jgi:hypothetical protein